MSGKKTFASELAYAFGILILAFGTAMMERANFGMSMVVAPAYLLHLKISQTFSWFSFGMAEYCLQAVLLVATALAMRKFKPMYLLSFVTAVIYGVVLDLMIRLVALFPDFCMVSRGLFYVFGMVSCSAGVSLLFHTYFAPEAYELLVKEISAKFGTNINKTKTAYDCTSCVVSIVLSFLFFGFGHFEGVKLGTVVCALLNGTLIGCCSKVAERLFVFEDKLPLHKYFS